MSTQGELPGGFGLWFAVVIVVICVVCSLPDLIKKLSHSEELGWRTLSRPRRRSVITICSRVAYELLGISPEPEPSPRQMAPRLPLSHGVEAMPQAFGREPLDLAESEQADHVLLPLVTNECAGVRFPSRS